MSFNYLIIYCTVVLPMVLCRILPPVSYISKITNGCHQPFCQSTALFLDSFNFSSFSQLFSSYMGEYCFWKTYYGLYGSSYSILCFTCLLYTSIVLLFWVTHSSISDSSLFIIAVSYTHLDVYKRQELCLVFNLCRL